MDGGVAGSRDPLRLSRSCPAGGHLRADPTCGRVPELAGLAADIDRPSRSDIQERQLPGHETRRRTVGQQRIWPPCVRRLSQGPVRLQREQSLAGHRRGVLNLPRALPPTKVRFRGPPDSRPGGPPRSGIGFRGHSPVEPQRQRPVFSVPITHARTAHRAYIRLTARQFAPMAFGAGGAVAHRESRLCITQTEAAGFLKDPV